jgi:hypothetical protein
MRNSTFSEPRKTGLLKETAILLSSIFPSPKGTGKIDLQNLDGTHSTTPEQLADTLTAYFQHIFSKTTATATPTLILPLPLLRLLIIPLHTDSGARDGNFTNSLHDAHKLHSIIKNMRNNASPGPDGLNVAFYKAAWPWVSQDVHSLVRDFYTSAFLQPELNQTFIALIPKKMQHVLPQDFRPISLCNVI